MKFLLDPKGDRIGSRVHCGDNLMLVDAMAVKRKDEIQNKRYQWHERQRKVRILTSKSDKLG